MSDADDQRGTVVNVPLVWVNLEESPTYFVNQFIGQVEQDDISLAFGTVAPPLLVGTPEEIAEAANKLRYVPVRTVCRLALTRSRLEELIINLQSTAKIYDDRHIAGGGQA